MNDIRVALTGAAGGYGRTLLQQLRRRADMRAAVLVDPDTDAVLAMLDSLGVTEQERAVSGTAAEAASVVRSGGVAVVVPDAFDPRCYDVLVEATGRPAAGYGFALDALRHDRGVVMVSKEVDSVAGRQLCQLAQDRGVGYVPGRGDQPANLLDLLARVEDLGLEVVAAGKAGEYDLHYDPLSGTAELNGRTVPAPGLAELLELDTDVRASLSRRAGELGGLLRHIAADYCEMAVVSQYTGLGSDGPTMHYPVARPAELADIYAERADGGLLGSTGVLDVFVMLRLPGEASFAGGVFVVVRTGDPQTWSMLREKGHVVSRDGRYACIYHPYHLMGVETPGSIVQAAAGLRLTAQPRGVRMAARATTAISSGTVLRVAGHHHEIDGCEPVFVGLDSSSGEACPFYLLDGARAGRDIEPGQILGLDDVEGVDAEVLGALVTP
ncbi:homoserine dehydrogenase [Ornithinimicrobium sp. W1679]|uniref:homoserine dehydrogenase n=1 Tax=Ornithinimicrobium sp. W1679 TaxID=3418770 RepID=UPI003CF270F5